MPDQIAIDPNSNTVYRLGKSGWEEAPIAYDKGKGITYYYDGGAWKDMSTLKGKVSNDSAGLIDNVVRSIARGVTFGFADEIAAAGNATVGSIFGSGNQSWGDRYNQSLTQERGRDQAFDESHPVASGAGQIGGAILGATAAPALAPFRGAGVAGTLGNTAVNAGVGGAIAGFGEGQGGLGPRLESAATGGAIGAVAGPAIHGAVNVAAGPVNRIWHGAGFGNSDAMADRVLSRAMSRDGVSVDDALSRARFLQDPQILPDIGGRNVTQLASVVARTPSEAAEQARVVAALRRDGMPDRVASIVDTSIGGGAGDDVARVVDALDAQRKISAAPLYQRAFDHPVSIADARRVQRFVGDPIGQDALQQGMRVMEVESLTTGRLFDPAQYGVTRSADTGRWIIDPDIMDGKRAPSYRLLDAVKRGYDEIVDSFRNPRTGQPELNQYGRAVNAARAEYRNRLVEINPAYGEALQAWAGPSASMDAVRRGQQALRVNRDVTAKASDRVADSDRPFYELGVGRAITDATSDPARSVNAVRRMVEDRQMQSRMASAVTDDMRRDYLVRALRRELDMAKVTRQVDPATGSQTMPLGQAAEDLGNDPAVGIMGRLLMAGATGGRQGIISHAASSLYRRGQGINSDVSDALVRRLFSTDPAEITQTLQKLRARQLSDALTREATAARMQAALTGLSAGTALEVN